MLTYRISVANQEPYNDIGLVVHEVYAESVYGASSADIDSLGLELVSSEYDWISTATEYVYQCQNGGTYLFADTSSVYGGDSEVFNDCMLPEGANSQPINGAFSRTSTPIKNVYNPGWKINTTFNGVSISDAIGHVRELNAVFTDTGGLQSNELWSAVACTAHSLNQNPVQYHFIGSGFFAA